MRRIEHLGDQTHVHVALGGARSDVELVTLCRDASGLEPGRAVSVEFSAPLFFDAAGQRIRRTSDPMEPDMNEPSSQAGTQTLIDHVEELTELDAAIGDGDHGLNMRRGALAIQAKLAELDGQSLNDALKTMGMTCMSTVGGSSGPVFGTLMVTLGKELPAQPAAADLARALAAGIAALTRLGKVEVGQKTLLDVLDPVQKVLAAGRRRPGRARAPMRARQRAGHGADGRHQGPRLLPRRPRARPRGPGLALDGADHRRRSATRSEPQGRTRHEEAHQRRRRPCWPRAWTALPRRMPTSSRSAPSASSCAGASIKPGKVALISGGGSGHEPLHAGFVGHGMLDAACPGQVFTSPTPDQMLAAAQSVDGGAGVLFIVKNYSGDMMNFQMAAEMLDRENATVIVNDDVAVENSTYTTGRRGVAGTLIVEKIVGAAAERGDEARRR